ncbi:MAG: geranylgeranylglycerol-phosphate geranylgeranyltransferase [Bacteroidota bacterium]
MNVLISVISFAVACFIATEHSFAFLSDLPFWGTVLTISIIASAGYWINDVYDFRIDRINKPGKLVVNAILSGKKVLTGYFLANMGILMFSFWYLGVKTAHYQVTFINFLSVLMLFVYASYLKRVSVAGNLVIAFLTALVVILAGYLYQVNIGLTWMIVFAFEITFIREIIKDIEDIKGDLKFNLHTLPIQIGIQRTKIVLYLLYSAFLISCYLPVIMHYLRHQAWLGEYLISSVILVQAPTVYLIYLLREAKETKDYSLQSAYLKYLIFLGLVTLYFL